MHILGVFLPLDDYVFAGLQKIFGVGKFRAKKICNALLITPFYKVKQLNRNQIIRLSQYIENNYNVGIDLQNQIKSNFKNLVKISSYRGIRHTLKLPVRGQRTHTNSQTKKKIKYV
uniref:Ribosomal protein S13 n=1 Tax=Cyanophora paradoxa TaxID=2762 RepID=E9P1D6_CYAPA|nr:ribosomal protein S13 [Cyanophora paradoxa]ADW79188.1 ribosomal protein S13 [Cyanophora paradoxa]